MLYCIVLYCIVLYCIVSYFIVLYCIVLYCNNDALSLLAFTILNSYRSSICTPGVRSRMRSSQNFLSDSLHSRRLIFM